MCALRCVVCLGVLQFLYCTTRDGHLYRAVCGRVTLGNLCAVRRKGYSFEWSYRLWRGREREREREISFVGFKVVPGLGTFGRKRDCLGFLFLRNFINFGG